jgi:hypothetical protein
MADTNETRARATSLVGACIASALLDALEAKGLLTLDEARGVLQNAMREVGVNKVPEAYIASGMIGNMLSGRFTARS